MKTQERKPAGMIAPRRGKPIIVWQAPREEASSRHMPHQGKREMARRVRRAA